MTYSTTGEQGYLDLIRDIMDNGEDREDRTGVGTRGLFGRQIRFNLQEGFPLLTTKKVFMRGITEELLWFLAGDTNAKTLEDKGVNIWREWGDPETRELGPVYGKQWRNWETPDRNSYKAGMALDGSGPTVSGPHLGVKSTDQITDLVTRLKADPASRRHLVVAWNPGEVDQMALPPCHCLFQFYVSSMSLKEREKWCFDQGLTGLWTRNSPYDHDREINCDNAGAPKQKLSCQLYQRSADIFLGVPFNIASYAMLTMMLAQQCGYAPGEFVHTFGDVHLYQNHFEQAQLQLSREPYPFPRLEIAKAADIFSYKVEDFKLVDYKSHPTIKAPVAV